MPSKVVVRIQVQVKPDQVSAFSDYVAKEAVQARAMQGCERYEVFRAAGANSDTFLFYEEWSSQADFDAYRASPLLKQSFQVLGPMMAAPPDSAYYAANPID